MFSGTMSETFAFNADIQQLMSLIIDTLCSNKDIFLRKLISNSSNALDKISYECITDPEKTEAQPNLFIKIILDNSIIMIEDSGIVMTKNELMNESCDDSQVWYQGFHGGHDHGRRHLP